jgi:epoxyqueuosine reductase
VTSRQRRIERRKALRNMTAANADLTGRIKERARQLGFSAVGCCPAVSPPGWPRFQEWLANGFAGEMRYLSDRADTYEHPRAVLAGARSLVVLTMNYRTQSPAPRETGQGRISRYAWGTCDYHDVIHDRLRRLRDSIRQWEPQAQLRGVVDTAPLLEREFGQLAGLGWIGKNTLLLSPQSGSLFFLAALLTDLTLEYDEPFAGDHCGTCRACLDACPTQAFPQAYVLDATRCISYLTIELRSAIPAELREPLGEWLFGCDICQDVCPWNSKAPPSAEAGFAAPPEHNPVDAAEWFGMDDAEFRRRFRRTPLWRAKRRGLLRNAAIVLGNQRSPASIPALRSGLDDADPLVRQACAWALGRMPAAAVRDALQSRLDVEQEAAVVEELRAALQQA